MLVESPQGYKTSVLKEKSRIWEQLEAKVLMDEHGLFFLNPKPIRTGQLQSRG